MDQWLKIRDILEDALELPPAQRPQFVHQACAGDPGLQREVEDYLHYEEAAELKLAVPAWVEEEPAAAPAEPDPERIGVYRILRRLGEGGMGVVYLAERADAEYRQQVALKALRPGPPSAQLLRLFRRERQILADLQHPNIARLMDGGTADGRVFYVMEYIDGSPVTTWCQDRQLTVPQRLKLFCRICEAVSYAHRKLIIHRDIKPGNILVTAEGTPKLLDFGLARVFQEGAGNAATLSIGPMLTPAYASPEQVRGEHLSTGADVYSLGVLLYELLTGKNPQAREEQSPLEVCRTILEEEPRPPSQVTPRLQRGELTGDLDNIVLMALRKEPEHRYASVDEMRDDIGRYLDGFPVHASRGTAWYRFRKYVGRHRWGIAVSALGAILMVTAASAVWWQGRQSEMRFEDVQGLAHSVIFELHDAVRDLPGSTGARKLIVERALEYLRKLEASGARKRSLQLEMAAAYEKIGEVQSDNARGSLGDTAAAVDSFLQARRLLQQILAEAPEDPDTEEMLVRVDAKLADVYELRGDEKARADLSRQALELQWKLAKRYPGDIKMKAAALRLSAWERGKLADWRAAQPLWRQTIEAYQQAVAAEPGDPELLGELAKSHDGLAQACNVLEQLPCAQQQYENALRIESKRLAARPDDTRTKLLVSYRLIDLGWIQHRLGKTADAVAHEKRALGLQEQIAAADPDNVMVRLEAGKTLITLGLTHRDLGNLKNSAQCLQKAVTIFEPMLQRDPSNQSTLFYLAWANGELGDVFFRRARLAQAAAARSRADWEMATAAYERSWQCLGKLKLGGKIDGFLDDRRLRATVPLRLAECRVHLATPPR